MEKNEEVLRRTRMMLLLLPVALVPLLTLGFYALGGGRGDSSGGMGIRLTKGLNMSLPEAKLDPKMKELNKLGFYRQSEQDSIKLREKRKMDPYYGGRDSISRVGSIGAGGSGMRLEPRSTDSQAGDLLRRLEYLKDVLRQREQSAVVDAPPVTQSPERVVSLGAGRTMGGMVAPASRGQGDADLDKLNTLMDKVLRVRYPGEMVGHDSVVPGREDRTVEVLSIPAQEERVTTLAETDADDFQSGFIDLDGGSRGDSLAELIRAYVDGEQSLVSGEAVLFRTGADAMLGGIRVPRGTAFTGKASLSGERLLVTVTAMRVGSKVIPVSLEVLGLDGLPGMRVKGSINRDVSKEAGSEAVGSLGVTSLDPGLAGQATAAGLQAARSLLNRKIRLVRVGLPAGYRVLLRNNKINR